MTKQELQQLVDTIRQYVDMVKRAKTAIPILYGMLSKTKRSEVLSKDELRETLELFGVELEDKA